MMDEEDVEDVRSVSRAEEIRSQSEEINFSPNVHKVMEQQGRVGLIERDYPSFAEDAEGRIQELTFDHFSGISTMKEGYPMNSMMNEFLRKDQSGFVAEAGSSMEDLRFGGDLGQPSGGMRMKVLSKSSGHPEYFVKNTLMGKGVLYRSPISIGAEFPSEDTLRIGNLMPSSSHVASRVDLDVNQEYTPMTTSDTMVNNGINLRDWIRSGESKLHKVNSLCIFKQVLDLVHSVHSEGKVLVDLRPSSFRLFPPRKVKYSGSLSVQTEMRGGIIRKDVQKSQSLKRPLEQGMSPYFSLGAEHQKLTHNVQFSIANTIDPRRLHLPTLSQRHAFSVLDQLEEEWYISPEEVFGRGCTSSSNVYCLGLFLFELLSSFDSMKAHASAMSDLHHRILPPNFLSENPKEAGFCLWLLHPEPSLRPTARDVVQSDIVRGFESLCGDDQSSSNQQDEGESELLLHFLVSTKEQKQKHASKLVEDLGCIEADIVELEKIHFLKKPASLDPSDKDLLYARERGFLCGGDSLSDPVSYTEDSRFMNNVTQLENAYFSMRSEIHGSTDDSTLRPDTNILKIRCNWFSDIKDDENLEGSDNRGAFFQGLCKYARYSKLEVCGTLRNRDITNSTNVICSLSFDRDEDYFAAVGVSKKIKIFDFQSLYDDSVDSHYPAIEMKNKSKLSCVCWNKYIRNYLASTDYDGIVKLWDASTGQAFSEFTEHGKRAWSVDFSLLDPTKLASGSDDCFVKLWSINEKNSLQTIRNVANVCCVQFSSHSPNMLCFGSADYKIYCYDLRNSNVPWCILAGHDKAVSYVKFLDSKTIVSASTDNTLKVWDLNTSNPDGISHNACSLTLSGHTNEKNFVGLSVSDGYVACGSETNEVYTYYKSLPMPITAHKFGSIDPISGKETDDDRGQFVSSVCWKGNSNVIIAANSSGCIKVLRIV